MLCDTLSFSSYKHPIHTNDTYFQYLYCFQPQNPKAGEVLYADLVEFHAMQKNPEVFTSSKTLPPIKRPEAYTETQYADITQFLKGSPEETGAELPRESTAFVLL